MTEETKQQTPFAVQQYGPFEDLPKDDHGKALLWAAFPRGTNGMPVVLKKLSELKDAMVWHGHEEEGWVVKRHRMTEEEFLELHEHPGW